MKLSAFRIRNFRSIIDTNWTRLAPDNITALIGQNESGKTSILEALNSFSSKVITVDMLRSDLSLPIISCEFQLGKKEKAKYISLDNIPKSIIKQIQKSSSITLNRQWKNLNDSNLYCGDDSILKEADDREKSENELVDELIVKAEKILLDTSRLVELQSREDQNRNELKDEMRKIEDRIQSLEKILQRNRNEKKKIAAREEMSQIVKEKSVLKLRFDKIDVSYQKANERINSLIQKTEYSERFMNSLEVYLENEKIIASLKNQVSEFKENIEFETDEKLSSQLETEKTNTIDNLKAAKQKHGEIRSNYLFAKECFALAVSGTGNNIEKRALAKVEGLTSELNLKQIAELFINDIPEIHLFEDFSSLLPNRIDLEDILEMNTNVEGYNAAKNFLIVSGLDAKFFRESSNRILKQKIENLNSDITVHFQDYWRQHLGKKNKIRLNFELEHYDFNHPDKKGKPYLEFWIKDEFERLYPKQRSRGVRWFLSFYLELKATALTNDIGKILLIDEPGLSLHARAQEDVLKVFEDLKENIQIVYSTHSPHLINTDKIHRLLAVQRADAYDDRSETLVFDAQSFSEVSGDTLSPIYTLLGSQISESNFIKERNNIIVEDTTAFYYLKTIWDIFCPGENAYYLAATEISGVPQLVNLMTGWKLKFGVLLSDNPESVKVQGEIGANLLLNEDARIKEKVQICKSFQGFENLFSTIDFKKYVLKIRTGITQENLEYVMSNEIDRMQLATAFALHCQNNSLKPKDFDEESRENMEQLMQIIKGLLN